MPRDITARHEIDSTVRIKLPRITLEVSRRHAERLRDALNAILPTTAPPTDRLYLLCMWGDVDPEVCGPYKDEQERTEAAQDSRRAHGEENGLFRIDTNGSLKVSSFTGGELEMPPAPKLCTLCRCERTGERFGLPVCEYHLEHTEDDPQCPNCKPTYDEQLEDGRQLLRELRDMPRVHTGDRVRDPLDNGCWRTVARIEGDTAYMVDGGCMNVRECTDIRLPSEALD